MNKSIANINASGLFLVYDLLEKFLYLKQTVQNAASDLDLQCLQVLLLGDAIGINALRKHAYSNIQKILHQKMKIFR